MAEEEKKDEAKKEVKVFVLSGSEFFENELTLETGKVHKIIVEPEKFVFSF